MDDMTIGIHACSPTMPPRRAALATRLDELNQERREIEARMQSEALAAVRVLRDPEPGAPQRSGVCLFDESWHQGVVGLVASRVKDRLRRPVIAFALRRTSGRLRGSARSVPGMHIRDVLDAIATREPGLISKFGGHAMAAGLTLERANLDRLCARPSIEEVARWSWRSAAARRHRDRRRADRRRRSRWRRRTRCAPADPGGRRFPSRCFDGVFAIRNTPRVSASAT